MVTLAAVKLILSTAYLVRCVDSLIRTLKRK